MKKMKIYGNVKQKYTVHSIIHVLRRPTFFLSSSAMERSLLLKKLQGRIIVHPVKETIKMGLI